MNSKKQYGLLLLVCGASKNTNIFKHNILLCDHGNGKLDGREISPHLSLNTHGPVMTHQANHQNEKNHLVQKTLMPFPMPYFLSDL
jgi:hypothetical protein